MQRVADTAHKFLTYDGDCPMCIATVGWLLRSRLVRPEHAVSTHELSPADAATAQAAGIRNQLVVIDPASRETRVGTDGLLWLLRDTTGNHPLVRLAALPGIRHLLSAGYKVISYNRRIISVPKHAIACDCEPQVTVPRRLSLVVPLLAAAVGIFAIVGSVVCTHAELGTAEQGALAAGAALLGSFLVVSCAAACFLPAGKRLDFAGHLAVVLFAAGLVLIPALLLATPLRSDISLTLFGISGVASLALMLWMLPHRVKSLGLARAWQFAWFVALAVSLAVIAM